MSSIQQRQKQILFWNTVSLQNIVHISGMLQRQALKMEPTQNDFKLRDFYFSKKLPPIMQISPQQTFIDKAVNHIKSFVGSNRTSFVDAQMHEMTIKKHQFWNRVYKTRPKNKEQAESKQAVRKIVWKQRMVPLLIFGMFGGILMHSTGILKLKKAKWAVGIVAMALGADIITRYRKSSHIFYGIPKLSDEKLEKQRKQIINETVVVDGTINHIEELHPFSAELIAQAGGQKDKNARKDILNAAGFTVVEKYDQEYRYQ